MNAWVRAAGKLARYEHIGWNAWPHRRCWSFHSGARAIAGSSSGSSRASWPADVARAGRADMGGRVLLTLLRSRSARWVAEHSTGDSVLRGRARPCAPSAIACVGSARPTASAPATRARLGVRPRSSVDRAAAF